MVPVLFLLLALISSRILSSPDLGWHIRAGERIVTEGAIPRTDDFSHTVAGNRWWVNQWLTEVVFYEVYERFGGYEGNGGAALIALRFLLAAGIWWLLLLSCRLSRERNEIVTGGALLLALLASASHMLLRPFLVSALLLAATGLIAESYRRRGDGRLWLLPVIFAVWAHVHPGFLYGSALLGAYCAGEWIRPRVAWLRGDVKPLAGARYRRLLLYSAGAVAAALVSGAAINPSGVEAVLLPIGLMKTRYFFDVLSEFQRAGFWRDRFFTALALLAVASVLPRRRRDATEIIAIAVFGLFAMRAVRVILPFAVVAAPMVARNLAPLGERLVPGRSARGRWLGVAAAAGILALTAWWWRHDPLRIPLPRERMRPLESFAWAESTYPVPAYNFIRFNGLPGEVFHPDQFGGSFIWYFYPDRKNFVDGRVEVFGEQFWQNDYFRILGGGPGWEDLLRRHGVNTLLLRQGSAGGSDRLNTLVPSLPEWALVYFDDTAVVYVRRGSGARKGLAERLALEGVDSFGNASPRSYEEELQARRSAAEMLEYLSLRAVFLHAQLLGDRGEWEEIAGFPDRWLYTRGFRAQKEALRRMRGEARFRIGDREGALADWRRAGGDLHAGNDLDLFAFPEKGDAGRFAAGRPARSDELARLAGLLREAGEFAPAAALLREAIRSDAGDSYLRNSLAWTLLEGEIETDEAVREAREAVRLAPDDGYARGTLGRALLAAGDAEGAEREMREAIDVLPAADYRTGASERAKLAMLLASRRETSNRGEIVDLAEEALLLDFETEENRRLARLMIEERGEIRLTGVLQKTAELQRKTTRGMRIDIADLMRSLRAELLSGDPPE